LQVPPFFLSLLCVLQSPNMGLAFPLVDFELAFTNLSHRAVHVAGSSVNNFMTTHSYGPRRRGISSFAHASRLTWLASGSRAFGLSTFGLLTALRSSDPLFRAPLAHLCSLCLDLDLRI
jgi:hypothetical protein